MMCSTFRSIAYRRPAAWARFGPVVAQHLTALDPVVPGSVLVARLHITFGHRALLRRLAPIEEAVVCGLVNVAAASSQATALCSVIGQNVSSTDPESASQSDHLAGTHR